MNILIELALWIPVLIYIISVFGVSILLCNIIVILIDYVVNFIESLKRR